MPCHFKGCKRVRQRASQTSRSRCWTQVLYRRHEGRYACRCRNLRQTGVKIFRRWLYTGNHTSLHRWHAGCMQYAIWRSISRRKSNGLQKVVTYILDTEIGSSLKAAGYKCEGKAGGVEWTGKRKPKNPEQYPRQMKTRWVKISKKQ